MGLRIFWCDVTTSTRALEARHLSGPAATQVLGEALASVALFSVDLTQENASVMLQLGVDGPVRGVIAEATVEGSLRGFTYVKVLDEFDGRGKHSTAEVLGAAGKAVVTKSIPGRILSRGAVAAVPPEIRVVAARYLNDSVQTPAAVQVPVHVDAGGVVAAGGLVIELMPDGDRAGFFDRVELMNRATAPLAGKGLDAEGVADFLGIQDMTIDAERPLQFKCRCSRDRVQDMLQMLPINELREIEAAGEGQQLTCHMCGQAYRLDSGQIADVLRVRESEDAHGEHEA